MKELSLNILDIAQNSVKAGATQIEICVTESVLKNLVSISVADNGCGMSQEFLNSVTDPFVTTRTTRKVGLGIPLLRQQSLDTNGKFEITSKLGEGTVVYADFCLDHLDRAPIGDVASSVITLISSNPAICYIYKHVTDNGEFVLNTNDVKAQIDDIPIDQPEILMWLSDYLNENLNSIEGGKI